MSEPDPAPLEAIARLVAAGRVCVLSGAGLSTESGIPDYRGPDGTRRVRPMEYAEFAGSAAARRRYWSRAHAGWARFAASRPNAGHRVVAALQREGFVDAVVTQNVDGLHQAAGARGVVELHGTLSVVRCLDCEDRTPRTLMEARLADLNPGFAQGAAQAAEYDPGGSQIGDDAPGRRGPDRVGRVQPDGDVALPDDAAAGFVLPTCRVCGSDRLKPDVVYFGESVPKDRVAAVYDAVDASAALLVLGSSLQVMSGYRFVRHAAKAGTPVAIVTRGRTRGDGEATHRLDAGLGGSLVALARTVGLDDDFGPRVAGEDVTGLPLGLR